MKKLVYLVLLGLLLLAACGSNSSSSNSSPQPLATVPPDYSGKSNPLEVSAAADGAAVYKANCVTCHGGQGAGDGIASQSLDPKPANLVDLSRQVDDDYLFWRISEGKPGTSMVAWKGILTEEQIWQAITFIRTLK